jgi:hypothetical protein
MLTVPVTVASAERSFSRLKIIKNYLKTTGWTGPFFHREEVASSIDYSDLMSEFAARKSRKVDFVKAA